MIVYICFQTILWRYVLCVLDSFSVYLLRAVIVAVYVCSLYTSWNYTAFIQILFFVFYFIRQFSKMDLTDWNLEHFLQKLNSLRKITSKIFDSKWKMSTIFNWKWEWKKKPFDLRTKVKPLNWYKMNVVYLWKYYWKYFKLLWVLVT